MTTGVDEALARQLLDQLQADLATAAEKAGQLRALFPIVEEPPPEEPLPPDDEPPALARNNPMRGVA